MQQRKKHRASCRTCNKTIRDDHFREIFQLCRECGSKFCADCVSSEMLDVGDKYMCLKCFERKQEERKVEQTILSKGW